MTDDRELLEMAAKAAGYKTKDVGGSIIIGGAFKNDEFWNPLTDDGDALRLAVKLGLDIRFDSHEQGVQVEVVGAWDYAPVGLTETFERDGMPATRRAIVRAAAEIGRTLWHARAI